MEEKEQEIVSFSRTSPSRRWQQLEEKEDESRVETSGLKEPQLMRWSEEKRRGFEAETAGY